MANAKLNENYYFNQINKQAQGNFANIYGRMMADYSNVNQAAFAQQQQQQQAAENQFYQKLYDTNQTVMDTIRRDNASAIASGASKGAQAAQELAALLQGQTESIGAATELADQQYAQAAEQQAAATQNAQQAGAQASELAANLANAQATAANADAVAHGEEELMNRQLEIYSNKDSTEAERAAAYAILQAKGFTPEMLEDYSYETAPENSEVRNDADKNAAATSVKSGVLGAGNTFTIWLGEDKTTIATNYGVQKSRNDFDVTDAQKQRMADAGIGQAFDVKGTVYIKVDDDVYTSLSKIEKKSKAKIKNYLNNNGHKYYVFN